MSKGIILLDMPENCRDCKYFGLTCKITGEKCNRYNHNGKPDWCPIKEIPVRLDEIKYPHSMNDYQMKGFQRGWNACIDEILKGE